MGNIRVRLIIEGRVQGVFFRDSTRREAARIGVYGWVRNRPEGMVELVAEGAEEKVRQLGFPILDDQAPDQLLQPLPEGASYLGFLFQNVARRIDV